MDQDQSNGEVWKPTQEIINNLRIHGEMMAAYGCLSMAGQIHNCIHTLHLVRNGIDNGDTDYHQKKLLITGVIAILESEMKKDLTRAHTHWMVGRGS